MSLSATSYSTNLKNTKKSLALCCDNGLANFQNLHGPASGNCLKNMNLNLQFHRKVGNFLDVTLFLCNSSLPKRQQ